MQPLLLHWAIYSKPICALPSFMQPPPDHRLHAAVPCIVALQLPCGPSCGPAGTSLLPKAQSSLALATVHSRTPTPVLLISAALLLLQASRYWILELPPMPHRELSRHIEERHPLCRFCKELYFTQEELYSHMRVSHFTCHVCERSDNYNHFNEPEAFLQHLRYSG